MSEPTLSPEQRDEAVNLAQKMAKAAGKVSPVIMAQACYMLMQTAVIAGAPDVFIEWKNKIEGARK